MKSYSPPTNLITTRRVITVQTESGSQYYVQLVPGKGFLYEKISSGSTGKCVCIFPSLVPNLEDTVRVTADGPFHCGWNKFGTRTFRILPNALQRGMVLVNSKGFRSTPIVDWHYA